MSTYKNKIKCELSGEIYDKKERRINTKKLIQIKGSIRCVCNERKKKKTERKRERGENKNGESWTSDFENVICNDHVIKEFNEPSRLYNRNRIKYIYFLYL